MPALKQRKQVVRSCRRSAAPRYRFWDLEDEASDTGHDEGKDAKEAADEEDDNDNDDEEAESLLPIPGKKPRVQSQWFQPSTKPATLLSLSDETLVTTVNNLDSISQVCFPLVNKRLLNLLTLVGVRMPSERLEKWVMLRRLWGAWTGSKADGTLCKLCFICCKVVGYRSGGWHASVEWHEGQVRSFNLEQAWEGIYFCEKHRARFD